MDGEKFDDLLKRICTTRLTRLDALRGLVAGAAATLTGASLGSDETTAKKKGGVKRKGGAKKRGGRTKEIRSATETTNTKCACTDDLSPKQCPAQSGIEYTCKLCPGIRRGSVQVACNGDTPSCFCQSKECVVGGKTFKKGQAVKVCTPQRCPTADSCDDKNPCTDDKCVNGFCVHKPVICPPSDNQCEEAFCDPDKGCTTRPVDCDDDDACTVDSCDPKKGCKHDPVDCDDDDACTVDSCDPKKGCKHTPVDCDDKIFCTVDSCDPKNGCKHDRDDERCNDDDACTVDVCAPDDKDADDKGCVHTPVDCDDHNACTVDSCDPKKGCKHDPVDCDDDIVCTVDSCDPEKGCEHDRDDARCDDDNACTIDVCDPTDKDADPATGCVHTPVDCDDDILCTVDTCDPVNGCDHTPDDALCPARPGCDAVCDPDNPNADDNGCVYSCICLHSAGPFNCKDACTASGSGCGGPCENICGPACPTGTEGRQCPDPDHCNPACFRNCQFIC